MIIAAYPYIEVVHPALIDVRDSLLYIIVRLVMCMEYTEQAVNISDYIKGYI